ncbi:radical SAM protein [Magnetococcus sp. PR-3]|uniref:radical SAM protein n=1 Tax=Magnetococcus sp. PR-3 TaxID=3120355 RepID=UPI002FCE68EC
MLSYEQPLYRPPSEGDNLILQATIGCSYNRCTFCSMYHHKTFRAKPLDHMLAEIDQAALDWTDARRIFLADGDALVLPTDHLEHILDHLILRFPRLQRVSSYALPSNLSKKSVEELTRLADKKLNLLYYGIESGDTEILKIIQKGTSPQSMVRGLWKAHEAGMKVSATVILGLGGSQRWQQHITHTAELINQAPLNYLSTLQLHLDPAVEQQFLNSFKTPFNFQEDTAILKELALLLEGITAPPRRLIFRSNHASNALALAGNLPDHREKLLAQIHQALDHTEMLRPTWMRSL